MTTRQVTAHAASGDDGPRIVTLGDERFAITHMPSSADAPLAAVVLLDAMTPDRLHAILRFWAALMHERSLPDDRISAQRRARLVQMLRAYDARSSGLSYREIAMALFPTHEIVPAAWRGDALRETTIRLVRDGLKHVRDGYRALLRRPRRRR